MDFSVFGLDRGKATPLYQQVTETLVAAIETGELSVGERLPSERELALQLAISRTTIVNAYHELESRGLVRGHVGRGTFICAAPELTGTPFSWRGKLARRLDGLSDPSMGELMRWSTAPEIISFAAGAPPPDSFPVEAIQSITRRLLERQPETALGHGPSEGQPALRSEIARRGGVRPEQVLVLSGSQQGLDLIARCLLDPGDTIIVDRPGFLGAIQVFRAAGVSLVGWDVAKADLDELEDLIVRYRPKLLYTNPTFQNPTGGTLPIAERRGLLQLAARYRLPVIEDEPYRELFFDKPPPPPLYHLDAHDTVISLGTFSKTFAPGFRLGYLIASPAIVDQLAQVKLRCDLHSPNLSQLVVAEFIRSGQFDRHLELQRSLLRQRLQVVLAGLSRYLPVGALRFRVPAGGMFLWCRLGQGRNGRELLQQALSAGVAFANGEMFYADGAGANELRLCFASVPRNEIEDGTRRLGRLWQEPLSAAMQGSRQTVPLV